MPAETSARDSLIDAEKSIAVDIWDYQAVVVKARILHFQSILAASRGDKVEAEARHRDSIAALKTVPTTSASAYFAAAFLKDWTTEN